MTTAEIVVVSGSYGAGHDAAADALSEQLRASGHLVRRLDVAEELPWRIGVLLRWLYFTQLRLVPRTWGATVRCLERDGVVFRTVQQLLGLLGRRLAHKVAGAELVVSTHFFASQALGQARARGGFLCPVVTYLTDASVQRLWVHPSVDLHLAILEGPAQQARGLGGETVVVRPVVSRSAGVVPEGWSTPWPEERPVALVVGGSHGVGELEASARDVLATGTMTPVVVCGTNDRLREHLETIPGVLALGWRDDMPPLIATATCVIQNAGGMTSLESLAAGTPSLTYRPIPGHGTTNAEALHAAGLVPWIADPVDALALTRLVVSPDSCALPTDAPAALDVLAQGALDVAGPTLVAA